MGVSEYFVGDWAKKKNGSVKMVSATKKGTEQVLAFLESNVLHALCAHLSKSTNYRKMAFLNLQNEKLLHACNYSQSAPSKTNYCGYSEHLYSNILRYVE